MKRLLLALVILIITSCALFDETISDISQEEIYGTWVLVEQHFAGDTIPVNGVNYIMDISSSVITIYDNKNKIFNPDRDLPAEHSYSWESGEITFGSRSFSVERDDEKLILHEINDGLATLVQSADIFEPYSGEVPPEEW